MRRRARASASWSRNCRTRSTRPRSLEKIATLAKEKKIDGISEVRDESDREGMRMVIELQRNAAAGVVLNNLYQHTAMQNAFHVNMVALVDGQPRVLTLRSALKPLHRLP